VTEPLAKVVLEEPYIFMIIDDVRIAKLGQDNIWISLQPGCTVSSNTPDHSKLTVQYYGQTFQTAISLDPDDYLMTKSGEAIERKRYSKKAITVTT
jgi:hypothetical protein